MSHDDEKLCNELRDDEHDYRGCDLNKEAGYAYLRSCNCTLPIRTRSAAAIERLSARVAELEAKIAGGVIVPVEPEADELAYVDRQIDLMWFYLREKGVDKAHSAEWAKHTRNAYLRMARRLAQLQAAARKDDK